MEAHWLDNDDNPTAPEAGNPGVIKQPDRVTCSLPSDQITGAGRPNARDSEQAAAHRTARDAEQNASHPTAGDTRQAASPGAARRAEETASRRTTRDAEPAAGLETPDCTGSKPSLRGQGEADPSAPLGR